MLNLFLWQFFLFLYPSGICCLESDMTLKSIHVRFNNCAEMQTFEKRRWWEQRKNYRIYDNYLTLIYITTT